MSRDYYISPITCQVDRSIVIMSHIVKLNVGGTRYETSMPTIAKYRGSLLGKMIQRPEIRREIVNGHELFIDRGGKTFEYIMRYLRDGDKLALSEDDLATLKQLQLEAEFFELDGLKAIIENKLRALTKDGWKIGDIVSKDDEDISYYIDSSGSKRIAASQHPSRSAIGKILSFRPDGKVAVQFEHGQIILETLKPKQA